MGEIITTMTYETEYARYVFTHPHEIADDLAGFDLEITDGHTDPWHSLFGGPMALDLGDLDGLIECLTQIRAKVVANAN